jgi:allantoin racemase
MRILYLTPTSRRDSRAGRQEMRRRGEILLGWAFEGTSIGVEDLPGGPDNIESWGDYHAAIPPLIERVTELDSTGEWDAVIVGCFSDPGLDALRECVSLLVIGPGEASALLATCLGDTFAVITTGEGSVDAAREQFLGMGLAGQLGAVQPLDISIEELKAGGEASRAKVMAAAKRAAKTQPDVLILGCLTLGFLGFDSELSGAFGLPVVNPARASLKLCEAALGLGPRRPRAGGMWP